MNSKKILNLIIFSIIITALCVFGIWFCFPDMESRGQFGDMFGAISALFSGFAFLGVIYTIFLQQEELSLQREELKLTREELKRSAKAQEKSEEALSKQAESLKITAKLNGLSANLQHYNTLIEITNSARYGIDRHQFNEHKKEADKIINEIKILIKDK